MALRMERVDRIIEELDQHRVVPHFYQDDGIGTNNLLSKASKFRQSASNLLEQPIQASGNHASNRPGKMMDFYSNKNPINEKDFFTNPQKYKGWDDKF